MTGLCWFTLWKYDPIQLPPYHTRGAMNRGSKSLLLSHQTYTMLLDTLSCSGPHRPPKHDVDICRWFLKPMSLSHTQLTGVWHPNVSIAAPAERHLSQDVEGPGQQRTSRVFLQQATRCPRVPPAHDQPGGGERSRTYTEVKQQLWGRALLMRMCWQDGTCITYCTILESISCCSGWSSAL